MSISPDQLPDDLQALKQIIAAMAQDAIAAQAEIAKLRFQLARYRRAEFGRSSEKLAREAEQLELAIEALEIDQAERIATASPMRSRRNRERGRSAEAGAAPVAGAPAARGHDSIPRPAPAQPAAVRCGGSAKRSPRRSITCPAGSR